MLRSEPRLDPEVEGELERLDAALHAFVADPDAAPDDLDAELLTLVADVRTARPALDVGAKMRLEERVQAAKDAPQRRTITGRMPTDRRWRMGLAAAAVVAVAIPVGVVVKGGTQESAQALNASAPEGAKLADETSSATSSSVTTAASGAATAGAPAATASGSAGGSAPTGGSDATDEALSRLNGKTRRSEPETRALHSGKTELFSTSRKPAPLDATRRVVRDVTQTVRINKGDVAKSAERVTTIVQDAGGYLGKSEVRERGSGAGGTFQVVVPTGRLDSTVAALSKIGRPVRLERRATDVTDQATSLADQLADLRSDRSAARLELAKTVDPAKRAARRRELTLLSSRVAALQGQVDDLRRQTATSRIDLRLTTSKAAGDTVAPPVDDGKWGIGDAWHDAGRVVEVGGGVLLIGGVIVLPLLALGGLGLALRRRGEARRRESVIDQA